MILKTQHIKLKTRHGSPTKKMDKIKLFREGKEFPFLNTTCLFDKYGITGTPRLIKTKQHALFKAKGL